MARTYSLAQFSVLGQGQNAGGSLHSVAAHDDCTVMEPVARMKNGLDQVARNLSADGHRSFDERLKRCAALKDDQGAHSIFCHGDGAQGHLLHTGGLHVA